MRTDIQPRCCLHHGSVMVPVEVCLKIDERDHVSFPAFACQSPYCDLHYDIRHGYFEISGGTISSLGQLRKPCPNDESPMYLASAGLEAGGADIYRCSQLGCDSDQTASVSAVIFQSDHR